MCYSVSVVCVYNNASVFKNTLVKSLGKQDYPFEIVGVKNVSNRFSSAAKALNYGAYKAKGDILIFVHQDVSFEESDSLSRLIKIYKDNSEMGDVAGIVGRGFDKDNQPIIIAGSKANFLGEKVGSKGFQADYSFAETVDEFLLLLDREAFLRHPFDEKTCNGWHFYAVEQCLNAKSNGHRVLVINTDIKHYSPGRIDYRFYWTQFRIAKKYRNYGRIVGTCCDFYSRPLYKLFLIALRATLKV